MYQATVLIDDLIDAFEDESKEIEDIEEKQTAGYSKPIQIIQYHECWSIGFDNDGEKLYQPPDIPKNISIDNIVHGLNGSTYILCNNNSKLIVFGYNMQGQLGIANYLVKTIVHYWLYLDYITDHIIDSITSFIDSIKYKSRPTRPISINLFKLNCISSGITSSHRFILTSKENNLYAAGSNKNNQLGIENDDKYHREKYYRFSSINYFKKHNIKLKQISTGHTYSLFLSNNGHVYACGYSRNGGLGLGQYALDYDYFLISKNDFIKIKIVQITTGHSHSLLLDEQNDVWSYGWNVYGQLGHGNISSVPYFKPAIIKYLIEKNVKIKYLATGYSHNILLDTKGKIYCFGYNCGYQCGDGKCKNNKYPKLNKTLKDIQIIDIKCGYHHNVVKSKNNEYYLWGNNSYHECLVFGNKKDKKIYVKIPTKYDCQRDFDCNKQKILNIYPGWNSTKIVIKNI